jgi:hypothetical protein
MLADCSREPGNFRPTASEKKLANSWNSFAAACLENAAEIVTMMNAANAHDDVQVAPKESEVNAPGDAPIETKESEVNAPGDALIEKKESGVNAPGDAPIERTVSEWKDAATTMTKGLLDGAVVLAGPDLPIVVAVLARGGAEEIRTAAVHPAWDPVVAAGRPRLSAVVAQVRVAAAGHRPNYGS